MNIEMNNQKRKEREGFEEDKNSSNIEDVIGANIKGADNGNIVANYRKSESSNIGNGKNESFEGYLEYRNQNTNEIINQNIRDNKIYENRTLDNEENMNKGAEKMQENLNINQQDPREQKNAEKEEVKDDLEGFIDFYDDDKELDLDKDENPNDIKGVYQQTGYYCTEDYDKEMENFDLNIRDNDQLAHEGNQFKEK